ncbi:HCL566Wp [Eremothecium sinecaudum]|uniref:HCL566Wp n=1 Tax=Eremothecium sinecaudum TaxID=45286 RepID=A0A109UW06_9SACH|nr:HCL566Wp [Eremothecium sinecaudum]AMD19585.1 HCL566Wp [Eremothecium sinecaudum]
MKFSHSLKYNAVPDWQDYYLNYAQLKRLIYSLQSEEQRFYNGVSTEASDASAVGSSKRFLKMFRRPAKKEEPMYEMEDVLEEVVDYTDCKSPKRGKNDSDRRSTTSSEAGVNAQEVFLGRLKEEKEKIDEFYKRLETQLYKQFDALVKDLESAGANKVGGRSYQETCDAQSQSGAAEHLHHDDRLITDTLRRLSHHPDDDDDEDDDDEEERELNDFNDSSPHTALLNYSDFTIKSQKRSILKKNIIDLYVELSQLRSFIELNRIGFFKITKKFDKTLMCNVRPELIESGKFFKDAYAFQQQTLLNLDTKISHLVQFYAIITDSSNTERSRKELRSYLRDYIVWERNTVWKDMLGLESYTNNISTAGKQDGDLDKINNLEYFSYDLPWPIRFAGVSIKKLSIPKLFFTLKALKIYIVIALTIVLLTVPTLNDHAQRRCLALVACVALLWATEALPLFVTSMLVPLLVVIFRVLKDDNGDVLVATAASSRILSLMWSSTIMVLLAGFTLAASLSKYNIARVLASYLLTFAGTKPRNVLLVVMVVVFFLSMWISNVAAPVLTYSLIHNVLRSLSSEMAFAKALVLGVALAANVGGMASPISSPQNVISMDYLKKFNIGWGQFFAVSIPVCIISLLMIWLLLVLTFKINTTTLKAYSPIKENFTLKQYFIIIVTLTTIALWCVLSQIESTFGSSGQIAVIPIVLLFGTGLLTTQDINNFPWSIVILAMGGIALGGAVSSSGLLATIARSLQERVMHYSIYAILVIFGAVMLVVGTFVSHTVSAIIIIPLVNEIGENLNSPNAAPILVFGCALVASCGMGLASSGFPNVTAISMVDEVGSRYLTVNTFITRGVPASILAYITVITLGYGIMHGVIHS